MITFISINSTANVPIISEYPNMVFHFDKTEVQKYNIMLLVSQYVAQKSLIVFYTNDLTIIELFIDFLVQSIPICMRPKCLISLFHTKFISSTAINRILQFAWSKKFLDFTILDTGPKNSTVHTLNPFYNHTIKERLLNQHQIFPKKLLNVNGYSINLPNLTKIAFKIREKNGVAKVFYNSYLYTHDIFKVMNFNISKRNLTICHVRMNSENLKKSNIHMNIRQNSVFLYTVSGQTFASSYSDLVPLTALVPVIPVHQTRVSFQVMINCGLILVIIGAFIWGLKRMGISIEEIDIFNVIRLNLGQSIERPPIENVSRIIFLTIVVIHVLIMSNLMLDIVEDQYGQSEVPFDTFEDLDNSQLTIYSIYAHLKKLSSEVKMQSASLRNIFEKINHINDSIVCVEDLRKYRNVACLMLKDQAKFFEMKYRNPDGSRIMKVAQPPIFIGYFLYYFEPASPYMERFVEIKHRYYESGIIYMITLMDKDLLVVDYTEEVVTNNQINVHQLVLVVSFGHFFALLAFFVEVVLGKLF